MGLCYQRARVFLLLIFINDSFRIKAKPNEHAKERGKDVTLLLYEQESIDSPLNELKVGIMKQTIKINCCVPFLF